MISTPEGVDKFCESVQNVCFFIWFVYRFSNGTVSFEITNRVPISLACGTSMGGGTRAMVAAANNRHGMVEQDSRSTGANQSDTSGKGDNTHNNVNGFCHPPQGIHRVGLPAS